MPSLQPERTGNFDVVVRHGGRRVKRSLKTNSRVKGRGETCGHQQRAEADQTLRDRSPDDVEPIELAIAKGQVPDRVVSPQRSLKPAAYL